MPLRPRSLAAASVAATLLVAHAGQAQVPFQGTANGCFTTTTCTPTVGSTYQSGVFDPTGLLQYNNATFSGTSVGGALAFGGSPVAGGLNNNNFGSFTLGTALVPTSLNSTFDLLLTFALPGGSATFVAPVSGTLTPNGSTVLVDFGSNGFGNAATQTVNAGAGTFDLTVSDVILSPNSTNDIKGLVSNFQGTLVTSAVPEPSSFALAGAGLLALAGLGMGRRRARD